MVLRMANVLANELGEFVTCGICTSEFDAEIRKPKFLQCAHTVCLLCLEKICHDETIVCPFCCKTSTQLDVNKLPNNGYILHMLNMLKFEEGKPKPASPVAISKGPSWCLTCGTLRKVTCTTPEHSSVNLTSFTLKNIEALVGLKEDLLEAKPEVASDLALSIKKRKKFKKHLKLLIKALTATIEEIDELQDENDFQMSQTNTELNEVRQVTATPHISDENFLSNLSSLLDDLNPKDMPAMDSLKFKLNKSFEDFEKRFQETVTAASYHELRGKLRIKISLFDKEDRPIPSTCPLFEQGFSLDKTSVLDNSLQQDLNLLSCLIFSLLRRQKIPLKATASSFPDPFPSVAQDPNPVLPSEDDRSQEKGPSVSQDRSPVLSPDDNIRSQEKIPSVLESIGRTGSPEISLPFSLPVNNKFIPGQSIFILRLWQCRILKGAIYIRPEPTFHPGFTQSLGEFCFQFPKIFFVSAMKALPEGLVLFPMTHPMFQPFLPDIISNFNRQMSRCTISGVDDVGVNKFIVSACHNKIIGWNFVFPIQCATLQPLAPVAELFGRVIHRQMSVSMVELSGSQAIDYTLTLESR